MIDLAAERRRRLTHRALPAVGAMAAVALVLGMMVGSLANSPSEQTARDFAAAWERRDYRAMYDLLTESARSRHGPASFERAYEAAMATATATRIELRSPRGTSDGKVRLPALVETRVFGPLRGELRLPVDDDAVAWAPHLTFPSVDEGERLHRRSVPPERARIVSRDGKTLADGPADARSSPLGELAASIAGRLEPAKTAGEREHLYARGFPRDMRVGRTGLERAFERRLAGRPGGELIAGRRVLARASPRPASAVRTTIDTRLQQAAVTALAGRFGGVAALDPRTSEVRALAGIAFSAPQPPGSTFKIVTTTAALEAGLVKPSTKFPVETKAVIDGVDLENANGESCGGTFQNSFAHSCNSVFAPLGVKIGAKRLVAAAKGYGWGAPPSLPGEVSSTLPPAAEIRTPLEVGSTAIGQGKVLATPLRMATVAETVAREGVRREPTLAPGEPGKAVRVTSRKVARMLESMMVDVVAGGTGTAAALPDVKVAGKTGTAELADTRGPKAVREGVEGEEEASNTDAWFTAYAPADAPRIVVAVLLVRNGAGGATAAPAARIVLQTALG